MFLTCPVDPWDCHRPAPETCQVTTRSTFKYPFQLPTLGDLAGSWVLVYAFKTARGGARGGQWAEGTGSPMERLGRFPV